MKIIRTLNIIWLIILIQACSSTRWQQDRIFNSSTNRDEYNEFRILKEQVLPEYSEQPSISFAENLIIYISDKDSVIISENLNKYSILFKSGLITPRTLMSNGYTIKIFKIEELTNPNKRRKKHRFKFEGGYSYWSDDQYIFFANIIVWSVEITNNYPIKSEELLKDISGAKLTFVWENILI